MNTKRVVSILLASVFLAGAVFAQEPEQKFASLGDFHLENGSDIKNLKVGYRTLGHLNAAKSNAVLFPTWFTGTTKQLINLVGSDKLVDSTRYFVVLIDALGDGISTSPSNSTDQPRMRFPQFSIRDMVDAEYALATKHLGLQHVLAVMGISMGGMQTFQWIVAYPDFMEKAIPIVGSPQMTSYDLLVWTGELHAIEADPAWDSGNYPSPPAVGMRTAADIHSLALTTPEYRVEHTSPKDFPEFLEKTERETMNEFDANNWIRQLQAMMADDVAAPFGGSMAIAAARVRAQILVVPSLQDHMVNPLPAINFAKLIFAPTLELTSYCGHFATSCETKNLNDAVARFLEK